MPQKTLLGLAVPASLDAHKKPANQHVVPRLERWARNTELGAMLGLRGAWVWPGPQPAPRSSYETIKNFGESLGDIGGCVGLVGCGVPLWQVKSLISDSS